ncbi:MAG: replication-associated recombination protein A [Clostridia bacterium]|nr:replication-associated recombination protein A [Clostridia bacterium]
MDKTPLANAVRPQSIDEVVGQRHLLAPGKPLRRIIESGEIRNMIFYGPSGVGKTTVAEIIAQNTGMKLHKLNGTSASTSDIKAVIGELDTLAAPNGILLYLDEIQYFNKKQQQTLLEHIEKGGITLIASTTENPYFYVYNAILSRSTVFEFKSVEPEELIPAIERAFKICENQRHEHYVFEPGVLRCIALSCGGDVRKALNAAELCILCAQINADGDKLITKQSAQELTQKSNMKFDRDGDDFYDALSAFQKSMRGSDPDAALHYLARLLEGGALPSACRRLMVCAAEDVGLAYPMIIPIVKAAVDTALMVGLPEARIPLADAVVLVCNSPKSNSAYLAYDAASEDIRSGKGNGYPRQLQNKHFDGEDNDNKGQFYQYPHDFENHWVKQQYLPDDIAHAKYYTYGANKNEQAAKDYWEKIKK